MPTQELIASCKELLIKHEGYSKYGHIDTKGKITLGIGYNVTDRGMDDFWINERCEDDIAWYYDQLDSHFVWFKNLNNARKIALIDMCFMGWKNFLEFKKMLQAFAKYDYKTAAKEAIDSKWARDVKETRANDIYKIIATGTLPTIKTAA